MTSSTSSVVLKGQTEDGGIITSTPPTDLLDGIIGMSFFLIFRSIREQM